MRSNTFTARALVAYTAAVFLSGALLVSCGARLPEGLYARLDTAKGPVTIRLEYRKTPLAAANFVGLAEGTLDATGGRHFYDGLSFHRVEPDFVVQGGDPAGDGSGDPGYDFPDEIDPTLGHDAPGIVAMANYGPDTNGSQFYITLAAAPALDGAYTVFGRVQGGMDVVRALSAGDIIDKVTVLRIGSEAKAFRSDQAAWDALHAEASIASTARARAARERAIAEIGAAWPGLVAREDGILSRLVREGSGPEMRKGALARIGYKGMLPDGKVFDQSILHGGPQEFEIGTGQVIPGWDMVIPGMRKGEKRVVAIPPEYAYGTRGVAGIIPPDSFLVFELEVVAWRD
jgi:peptidylprolyl isomerase